MHVINIRSLYYIRYSKVLYMKIRDAGNSRDGVNVHLFADAGKAPTMVDKHIEYMSRVINMCVRQGEFSG